MNPYVKIFLGNAAYCTQPGSGKNPVWTSKNEFRFKAAGEPIIRFAVFDRDTFSSDDCIAEG